MKMHLILTAVSILMAAVFTFSGCSGSSSSNPVESWQPDSKVVGLYKNLEKYIVDINTSEYDDVNLSNLQSSVTQALGEYKEGDVCTAVETLSSYLDEAQRLRQDIFTEMSEDLFNRGWMLAYNTLSRIEEDLKCSGDFSSIKELSDVNVTVSDINTTEFTINFSLPKFVTRNEGNETFTQVGFSDMPSATTPLGHPDIPYFRRYLLLPKGATPTITFTFTEAQSFQANIYPSQEPLTDLDESISFDKNESIYLQNSNYPAKKCSIQNIGAFRSVELLEVACPSGYTNPVTDTITTYASVHCLVDYGDNSGTVMEEWGASPFESTAVKNIIDSAINTNLAREERELYIPELYDPDYSHFDAGEEFIIITHEWFKDAAERLAVWKNKKGLITKVFSVEEIQVIMNNEVNITKAIDSFIEYRYDNMIIKPVYVLILGGYFWVPQYERVTYILPDDEIDWFSSDYGYADYKGSNYPFFSVGRVRVTSLDQTNYYVDNVISYESNPPLNDSFYKNAVTAGYFEGEDKASCPDKGNEELICTRTNRLFIETSEFVRNTLLSYGKEVDRIYAQYEHPDGDSTPTYYFFGQLLPDDIGYGSDFVWDGNGDDVGNAINDGRFLIIHRDHGSPYGWSHPDFTYLNVRDLQNGLLLPVIFSINCFSGQSLFVDTLLIQNSLNPTASTGGAIGIIASTAPSYSWHNDHLTEGLIDAIFPNTLENYGSINSIKRLGDILTHGKYYMGVIYGIYDFREEDDLSDREKDVRHQIRALHTFGDPTLELWTEEPELILMGNYTIIDETNQSLEVAYTEDAILTAYQETEDGIIRPLGRAEVEDGKARISYIIPRIEGLPVLLSASKENLVSVMLTPNMELSTDSIDLGLETDESSFSITNSGGGTLSWSVDGTLPSWLTLSPAYGEIESTEKKTIAFYIDRDGLINGSYEYNLSISWEDGGTKVIDILMSVNTNASGLFQLTKTGQTDSYWDDGEPLRPGVDGEPVSPKDDGYYEYGIDFDFTNNGNDTITDNNTELIWDRNYAEDLTMAEAEAHCSAKGAEWRVPNVYEYLSILNYWKEPALDEAYFNLTTSSYFWTSTNAAGSSSRFWTIREKYASLDGGSWDTTNNIRCVKGEELAPPASGRFTKISSSGVSLEDDASSWVAVKDNWSGLLWQKSDNGTTLSWEHALGHCEGLTTAGKNWHLPNIKQMHSVMDMTQENPALDPNYFSVAYSSNVFWTSTTDMYTISSSDYIIAWAVQQYHAADVIAGIAKTDTESYNAHTAMCVSWE